MSQSGGCVWYHSFGFPDDYVGDQPDDVEYPEAALLTAEAEALERTIEHICVACKRPVSEHSMRGRDGIEYWPPVCCKACPHTGRGGHERAKALLAEKPAAQAAFDRATEEINRHQAAHLSPDADIEGDTT